MADDAVVREKFVGVRAMDVPKLLGVHEIRTSATLSIEAALAELKNAEGRLIYAQHLLNQEYSRVFAAISSVKIVVQSSVVLTTEAYDRLLDTIDIERDHVLDERSSASFSHLGRGKRFAAGRGATTASFANGGGGGSTDPAPHTCTRRSLWNARDCKGCKRDFGDASDLSCEDSE